MHNPQLNSRQYTGPRGAAPGAGVSAEEAQGEYIFSLGDLLQVIRKRFWVVLLVMLVLTGAAAAYTFAQTPMYQASIKVLVRQERVGNQPGSLGGDVQGLKDLTKTMVEGVNSRPIAEAVVEQLNLQMSPGEILGRLSTRQVGTTQFIQISYQDPSPERARLVADTIGEVFSTRIYDLTPSTNAITATVWESAEVPSEPVSPSLMRNIGLGLGIGLMLGVGLAFLLEYLDDSWRSPEEAERISGVPTFGVIPEFRALKSKKEES